MLAYGPRTTRMSGQFYHAFSNVYTNRYKLFSQFQNELLWQWLVLQTMNPKYYGSIPENDSCLFRAFGFFFKPSYFHFPYQHNIKHYNFIFFTVLATFWHSQNHFLPCKCIVNPYCKFPMSAYGSYDLANVRTVLTCIFKRLIKSNQF